MRWVFFSLLILNVVYGIWRLALGVGPEPVPVSRAMASAPQSLTLLQEVPESERQRRFDRQAGSLGGLCPAIGPFAALSEADEVLAGVFSDLEDRRDVRMVERRRREGFLLEAL